MNQEYLAKNKKPQTQEQPQQALTTPERAEQYSKERLEQILEHLEKRNLKNISPYRQFQELLNYLREKQSPS